jgi:hypothetical protein
MSETKSLALGSAILYGAVIAGMLDAADGVVAYYLAQGFNPIQVLQFIASGFYGAAAFQKGLFAAFVGLVAHFFIASIVSAIYVGASRLIFALGRRPVLGGTAYGAAVFLAMNFMILPHTAVVKVAFSLPLFLNGIIGHSLLVGLPIALAAHRARPEWKLASETV